MPQLWNFQEFKGKVKCVVKNITVEPCLFLLALCMVSFIDKKYNPESQSFLDPALAKT